MPSRHAACGGGPARPADSSPRLQGLTHASPTTAAGRNCLFGRLSRCELLPDALCHLPTSPLPDNTVERPNTIPPTDMRLGARWCHRNSGGRRWGPFAEAWWGRAGPLCSRIISRTFVRTSVQQCYDGRDARRSRLPPGLPGLHSGQHYQSLAPDYRPEPSPRKTSKDWPVTEKTEEQCGQGRRSPRRLALRQGGGPQSWLSLACTRLRAWNTLRKVCISNVF